MSPALDLEMWMQLINQKVSAFSLNINKRLMLQRLAKENDGEAHRSLFPVQPLSQTLDAMTNGCKFESKTLLQSEGVLVVF